MMDRYWTCSVVVGAHLVQPSIKFLRLPIYHALTCRYNGDVSRHNQLGNAFFEAARVDEADINRALFGIKVNIEICNEFTCREVRRNITLQS